MWKSVEKGPEHLYWPGIDSQITQLVGECYVCQERKNSKPSEPLMPHEVPTRPWQIVGTDLFKHKGREYLLFADYYSIFPIVEEIPTHSSNPSTVIKKAQKQGSHLTRVKPI